MERMEGKHWLSTLKPAFLQPLHNVQSDTNRDEYWAHNMASFSEVIMVSQVPGGRLLTLDHFHHGRGSILFLLE